MKKRPFPKFGGDTGIDADYDGCQEEWDGKFGGDTGVDADFIPHWVEEHSVNCYFCGELVDERECMPADEFNDNDGGDICPDCLEERQ